FVRRFGTRDFDIAAIDSVARFAIVLSFDSASAQKTARSGFARLLARARLGYDRRHRGSADRIANRKVAAAHPRNSGRSARRRDCRSKRGLHAVAERRSRARVDRIAPTTARLARAK